MGSVQPLSDFGHGVAVYLNYTHDFVVPLVPMFSARAPSSLP